MSKLEQNKADGKNTKLNEKTILKDSTKFLILAILIVILIVLIPIGYALFSNTKQENVSTHIGKIKVELVEEGWPDLPDDHNVEDREYPDIVVGEDPNTGAPITEKYTEAGTTKNTKSIYGHSADELDAYVRVRCIPIVQYFVPDDDGADYNGDTQQKGNWVTLPVTQNQIVVNVTSEDDSWVKDGDYWYYKNILKANNNTKKMNIEWEVAEIPNEVYSYAIRTDVRVILEYSQTTNDMWKEVFQINNLPAGIETPEGGVTE